MLLLIKNSFGRMDWKHWQSRRSQPRRRRPQSHGLETMETRLQLSPSALLGAVPAWIAQAELPEGNDVASLAKSQHSSNSENAMQPVRIELPIMEIGWSPTVVVSVQTLTASLTSHQSLASRPTDGIGWSILGSDPPIAKSHSTVSIVLQVTWFSWTSSTSITEGVDHNRSVTQPKSSRESVRIDTPAVIATSSKSLGGAPVAFTSTAEPLTRSVNTREGELMAASITPAVANSSSRSASQLNSRGDETQDDLALPIDTILLRRMFDVMTTRPSNRLIDGPIGEDGLRRALLLDGLRPLAESPPVQQLALPIWDSEIENPSEPAPTTDSKQPMEKAEQPESDGQSKSDSERKPSPTMKEDVPPVTPDESGEATCAAQPVGKLDRDWRLALKDPRVWFANLLAIASSISAWPSKGGDNAEARSRVSAATRRPVRRS